MFSANNKGKKPQALATSRFLSGRPPPPKTSKPRKAKASTASTNSKPSSTSTPAPLPVPLSSAMVSSPENLTTPVPIPQPVPAERSSSPSPQAQSSASSSSPVSHRKRPRNEEDSEEDEPARKTKWRGTLEVMQHDVDTRKVSKAINSFHDQARLIPRLIHPFVDPLGALLVGRAHSQPGAATASDSDEDEDDVVLGEEELRKQQARRTERAHQRELLQQYDAILYLIPDLASDIHLLDDDDIDILAAYIKYDSGKARTTDFNHVSDRVWRYIAMCDYFTDPPASPEKWECGWEGFCSSSLLCPPPLRDLYETDWEEFCKKVKDPKSSPTIVADDWPIFLFDMDSMTKDHKPHGPLSGFLRSKLFELMLKSIWTGPISTKSSGARAKSTPGKPPLSHKYQIDVVSPRMLAYVAVLLRHALTAVEWNISDLQFNNSDFFDKIIALFDEPTTPWAAETVEWWNREIFGTVACPPQADPGRKTIAEAAREHDKAVRRAMKAGLDPLQITTKKKRPSPRPAAKLQEASAAPVASSSTRAPSAVADDGAKSDAQSRPVGSSSLQHIDETDSDAEYD